MTVTGGPENTEPTIAVTARHAFTFADGFRLDRTLNAEEEAALHTLVAEIEAQRPPPPMPDIEWRGGTRVQRRGAEGVDEFGVYLGTERVAFLPGDQWRLVSTEVRS